MRLPMIVDPRSLLDLLPRAMGLLDSAEVLLRRLDPVVDRVDGLLDRMDELMDRVDELVGRIDDTRASADKVIVRTAGTVGSVDPTMERVDRLVAKGEGLLDSLGPSLEKLEPTLRTLADTTSEREVGSIVQLVDHLPHLVQVMDEQILPILANLQTVSPDVHALLDTTRDLTAMLAKVPGLGRLRREDDAADGGSRVVGKP